MEGAQQVMNKFIKACEESDYKTVRNLLSYVSEPSFPRKELEAKLMPPVYWACKGGSLEIVKLLIHHYPGCNPHFLNGTGSNLLYVACARGHINVVNFLNAMYSVSPVKANSLGTTPIFVATYNGHFEMLKFLIYNFNCDPKTLNSKGESLLHIACDRDHQKVARYLVEEHHLDPTLESASKRTPLHSACCSGNLLIAKYLIEELHVKVDVFDQAGYMPLHIACRNGCDAIVRYFIQSKQDLHMYDESGYMPLHVACRFRRISVVKTLLNEGNVDPNILTFTQHNPLQTPLQITKDESIAKCLIRNGAAYSPGLKLSIFQEYKLKYPLNSTIHVFVIGHSASGKSTLVKALQISAPTAPFSRRPNMEVQPHTVGVVPIEFNSPEFGNVVLYDFAGHYEFHPSHAALLEHSKFTSPPLFILLFNLMDTVEELKRQTNYWVQFVEDHTSPKTRSPHIFVIGSHFDKIQDSGKVSTMERHIKSRLDPSISPLKLKEYFSIDCRTPGKSFRISLKECCNYLHSLPKEVIDPACHILSALLAESFNGHLACNIECIIEAASASDYPLPLQVDRMCVLAESLSACTKFLFLRNSELPKKSWIVLDIYALLHNINGKIFAPTSFPENVFKPMNTGILTWSELSQGFPDLDPSLVVLFLCRLELCQVISDKDVLNLISGDATDVEKDSATCKGYFRSSSDPSECRQVSHRPRCESCPLVTSPACVPICKCDSKVKAQKFNLSLKLEEMYLFFPGLITPEEPKDNIWTSGEFEFYSGWCLKCDHEQKFFSLRFLHTLLLRLSFGYAITKSANGMCEQLECTLWKNGLRWLNMDGIETIVEMIEDRKAVLLLIRMKKGSVLKGLQLRAALIRKILETKKEYCSRIAASESFIDPAHLKERCCYPVINRGVNSLRRFDITRIAKAFCTNKRYVPDVKAEGLIEVDELVGFDPYMRLGIEFLQRLYQKDKQYLSLTQDLLLDFSLYYPDKASTFESILLGDDLRRSPFPFPGATIGRYPPSCFDVLHRYWESETLTLADFREKLDSYSIFSGRNILEYS